MPKSPAKSDEPSFEDAMQRLDEIVSAMESDKMPLEEMIHRYEEGVVLLKACRQHIETARRRVELITQDIDSGKTSLKPFDEDEAAAEEDDVENAESASVTRQSPPRRRKTTEEEIRLF